MANPEAVVAQFLGAVRDGDVGRAIAQLDRSKLHVPPRAGYEALFRYETCQEPNLAFLLGRRFELSAPKLSHNIRSEWYVLDGIKGVALDVQLELRPDRDAPFLLPEPLAAGRPQAFAALLDFARAPDLRGGLTLRLRPTVEPGLIKPPPPEQAMEIPPPPVTIGTAAVRPMRAAVIGRSRFCPLGTPEPRDPGPVRLPSGEALTPAQLAAFLPRLKTITLQLVIMKQGHFAPWRVSSFVVKRAVVIFDGIETPRE